MDFKNKYLKYKKKYMTLKTSLLGGADINTLSIEQKEKIYNEFKLVICLFEFTQKDSLMPSKTHNSDIKGINIRHQNIYQNRERRLHQSKTNGVLYRKISSDDVISSLELYYKTNDYTKNIIDNILDKSLSWNELLTYLLLTDRIIYSNPKELNRETWKTDMTLLQESLNPLVSVNPKFFYIDTFLYLLYPINSLIDLKVSISIEHTDLLNNNSDIRKNIRSQLISRANKQFGQYYHIDINKEKLRKDILNREKNKSEYINKMEWIDNKNKAKGIVFDVDKIYSGLTNYSTFHEHWKKTHYYYENHGSSGKDIENKLLQENTRAWATYNLINQAINDIQEELKQDFGIITNDIINFHQSYIPVV